MGVLTITTLGDPQVQHDAVPCPFTTRKALALTLYLAVTAQPHPRAHLIALLWPEADAAHGSTNLRQTLGRIRQALGADADAHVLTPGDLVRLEIGADGTLDLTQVTAAIPATTASARRLAALGGYQGSFCESLAIDDAPDFMAWVQAQRAHWDACYDVMAEHEMQVCLASGQAEDAVTLGKAWVRLRPDTEVAYRLLATAQATMGDVTGARLTLADCAQVWANLALALDPATVQLQEQMQALPAIAPAALAAHAIRLPFVGRQEAFSRLRGVYERTQAGRPHLALIEGEAGVGKSRLLGAFTQWAALQGADVVQGQAYELSGRFPFQPLAELVRARLAREHAPDDLLDDPWLTELSRLVPELRERYPDLPPPVDDAGAGARLIEALAQVGLALGRSHPVVWVIEDLHWADEASRAALTTLLGRWQSEGVAILLVVTLRVEERATSTDLQGWVAAAERLAPVVPITLAALTADDSQHAAMKLLSNSASPALCDWLFTVTAGNPLYLEQVAQGLVERGVATWQDDSLRIAPALDVGQLANWLPDTLRELLLRRIRYLDATTQRVVAAAAVAGGRFTEEVVQAIAGVDEEAVLTALEVAEHRQLIRSDGNHYVFTHDKVAEAVYSDLTLARRRYFHRRAYNALETRKSTTSAGLAFHAMHADLLATAFRHFTAAGDAAWVVGLIVDAIYYYEQAEHLLAHMTPPEVPDYEAQLHLYSRLTDSYLQIQATQQKLASEQQLLRLARIAHDATWIQLGLGYVTQSQLLLDPHSQHARASLAEMYQEELPDPHELRLEIEWNVAQFAVSREDWGNAQASAAWCLHEATTSHFPEYQARSHYLLGQIAAMIGQWEDAQRELSVSQELYGGLTQGQESPSAHPLEKEFHIYAFQPPQTPQELRAIAADCWSTLGSVCLEQGKQDESLQCSQTALTLAHASQSQTAEAIAANTKALALVESGHYEAALQYGTMAQSSAFWSIAQPLRLRLGWIDALYMLGDVETPLMGLRHVATLFQHKPTLIRFLLLTRLCVNRLLAGKWKEAASIAQLTSQWRQHSQRLTMRSEVYRYREIEALLREGDSTTARRDIADFIPFMVHNPRYRLIGLRMQAKLALFEGSFGSASDHLQQAHRIAQDLHLPGEQWQIQAELAALFHRQGDMSAEAASLASVHACLTDLAARLQDPLRRKQFLHMAHQEIQTLLAE